MPSRLAAFTSDMSFIQRVMNSVGQISFEFAVRLLKSPSERHLKEKYNIAPEKELEEVLGNAELVLILGDFSLEYPQPLLPGLLPILNRIPLHGWAAPAPPCPAHPPPSLNVKFFTGFTDVSLVPIYTPGWRELSVLCTNTEKLLRQSSNLTVR